MIREIIVEFESGDNSVRKRILDAIIREIGIIALESGGIDPLFFSDFDQFENTLGKDGLPQFPGKVIINTFDENEELIEVIES